MSEETQVTVETEEIPLAEASMAEFKKARADGKETATRETVVEEKPPVEAKPKIKGGFQARIDRLIKQTASLEEAKTAAEKRAAEAEAKLNGNGNGKTAGATDEPQRDSFQTEAEYVRALTRWEVKQEIKAEREAQERQAVESQIKEARSKYNAKMIAIQAENEEYKELLEQDIKIPSSIEGPITLEMENGPEVAIFLAQNPEICQELLEMTSSRAIAEVWKISEKLEAAADKEGSEEEEEVASAEPEKPTRKAPAPIKPISSGTSRSTIPLDSADFSTYKKLRAQGRVQ